MQEAMLQQYERARRQLHAVAARYVGDEAEDVVQEAFLRALRCGHAFRGDAAPLTWLHRIVMNAAIDRCRRRSRRDAYLRHLPPPAVVKAASEEAFALRAAVRQLPSAQCRVFVLYDLLGHTHEEIARRLAIPKGTSRRRLLEARRRRQEALQPTRTERTRTIRP